MPRDYTTNTEIRDDLKAMRVEFRNLRSDIAGVKQDVAVGNERIKPVVEMARRHERILNGNNGDSGMIARVEDNGEKLNNIQWWFRAAMVGILGDFGLRIYKYFV